MQRTRILLAVSLLAASMAPAALARAPHTLGDLAWIQLRIAAHGQTPIRMSGQAQVLRHVTHRTKPPPVRRIATAALFQGTRRVVSPGSHAVVAIVRTVRIGGDGIARPSVGERRLVRPAAPATVLIGTAAVHHLVRGGVRYRYLRETTMVATAYNASYSQNGPWGPTAALDGAPLARGMVAVDPAVIPLGTRLYVEGYGPALAADTGSAIIGDRIDLFFDLNTQDTARFGIRRLHVYILGPQGGP